MRRVWLPREDFGLFHQDISPYEFEFFRSHAGAFKRMWHEQSRRFWSKFVSTFDYFIWNHGIMKDFPMTEEEAREYVDEIMGYIREQFVEGRFTSAKALIMDCVVVAQNRNCILLLEKANYAQSPFVMKETREVFRQLFGPPTSKRTFMKVLCGLPVYVKFAGAAVSCLRRWLTAETISNEKFEAEFLASVNRWPRRSDTSIMGCTEDLLKVVGRLHPPTSTGSLDKPKKISKPKVTETSSEPGVEEGEGSGKKKRKKKKKAVSDKEGMEDGHSNAVSKVEGEKLNNEDKLEGEKVDEKKKLDEKKEQNVKQSVEQKLEDGKVKNVDLEKEGEGEVGQGVEEEREHKCVREGVKQEGAMGEEEKVGGGERTGKENIVTESQEADTERKEDKGHTGCSSSGPSSPTDSGIGSGVEHVAMETPYRPTNSRISEDVGVVGVAGEKESRRRKLHVCACCGEGETVAKTFKRCQKCRGLPNPNYYCSRECQAKHWKEHKLDHRGGGDRGEAPTDHVTSH